jgi:hypothetical protein
MTSYSTFSGCEPLTPDDIAEVVVFAAGRRENVVLADALIFPNHQVSHPYLGNRDTRFPIILRGGETLLTILVTGRCNSDA